jgi:vacuolar-type H+-ATPase subunit E/Vma4
VSENEKAEALLEAMRQKAGSERSDIEKQAESSVSEIRGQAESTAAKLKEEALQKLEAELEDFAERARLGANMKAASARSAYLSSIIEEVFQEAAAELDRFVRHEGSSSISYGDTFAALVIDAARGVSGKGTMKISAGDADLCREALRSAGIDMTVETSEDTPGTVIAASEDGSLVVNNSVQMRLERARTRLTPLILKVLGGELSE